MATKATIKELQRSMREMGLYTGNLDGIWGPMSHGSFINARKIAHQIKCYTPGEPMSETLYKYCKATAWSNKVSPEFVEKTRRMAKDLKLPTLNGADWLMACMAFETGETFSPSIKNGAGAPYYGLIQFGAAAAKDVGTTTTKLVKMTAEEQLDYVYKFFKPYTGRIKTLASAYMRILWPVAVDWPDSRELWNRDTRPTTYRQNRGLDLNGDGFITKGEAAVLVEAKLTKGLNPVNLRV